MAQYFKKIGLILTTMNDGIHRELQMAQPTHFFIRKFIDNSCQAGGGMTAWMTEEKAKRVEGEEGCT